MSVYSKILEVLNGMDRQIDLSTNTLAVQGLQINGAVSGAITHAASATTTSYTLTWPSAQAASAGYVLANNGSGVLSWVSAAAGSALDGTFRIQNSSDATKQLAFDASSISHATTRTITMPDANVDLGNLTNSNIAAAAAIAYSKLNLAASVKSSDQNSQGAVSTLALFSDGSGSAAYRAIASGDLPSSINANTSGTAANITATSNSSLTTLSALSLPTSQLSGSIALASQVSGQLPIANGGTGQATAESAFNALSPMTTSGDIIYMDTTPKAVRLPIGSLDQILTVIGGLPTWANPASAGIITSITFTDASAFPIYATSSVLTTGVNALTLTLQPQAANVVFAGPAVSGTAQPTFRSLVAADIPSLSSTYVLNSRIGAASGVASLDVSGKIPTSQLPSTVLQYEGLWDPSTNTPTLSDVTGTNGYVYQVSVAHAAAVPGLANATMVNFLVGNLIIYSGAANQWEQTTPAAGVSAVNGAQGSVTVNAINQLTGDVTAGPASQSQSMAATIAAIQGTAVSGTTGSGNVVFSASPTFTGTIGAAAMTLSSTLVATGAISGSNLSSTGHASLDALKSNNLSDLASVAQAFDNISPLTATGDMIYEASPGSAARLPIGSAGYILTVVAGVPAWAASAVSPSAIALTSAHILVGNGSNVAADVAMSGDVTIDNTGATTIGSAKVTASKLATVTDGVTLDQIALTNILEVKAGGISNAQINASAAIAYSKLSLTSSIVNADISGSAAIAYSKLSLASSIQTTDLVAGAVTAAKLGTVTDGTTLDQSGAGSTLEIKAGGVGTTQLAAASVTLDKLGTIVDGSTLDKSGASGTFEIKAGGVTPSRLGTITDNLTLDQSGAGSTLEIKNAGVTAAKLATGVFDGASITGGNGSAAVVQNAPSLKRTLVAGQSFSANTSYAVRWGITAKGETAGRIYVSDITTSSYDLFYVIGMALSTSAVSAGGSMPVTTMGSFNLGTADAAFASSTDGQPVFLAANGAFSLTPPSTAGQAVTRIGILQFQSGTPDLNVIDVDPVPVAVN